MTTRTQQSFADRAARLLSLGANPTRVLIVQFLRQHGGAYVQEIADELDMTQSAVSHQLRILEEAGILVFTKKGRAVRYQVSRKASAHKLLKVLQVLAR